MQIWTIQRRKKYRGHDTKGRQTKWITTQKSNESYKDEQHDPPALKMGLHPNANEG